MAEYQIKIYKIWYADNPTDFYIGSTKEALSARMAKHRNKVKQGKASKIYSLMREKGINNFQYILVATCMVRSVDEQRQFEQHFISELKANLNTYRAFATEEERKEDKKIFKQKPEYKAKQQDYMKEYEKRPEVKEKRKEKAAKPEAKQQRKEYRESIRRTCVCGCIYRDIPYYSQQHYNTKKHIDYVTDFRIRIAMLLSHQQ